VITITLERPDSPDAVALVEELDALLIPMYPIESHHGLDVTELVNQDVYFFVARLDGAAAGCGGLKFYGKEYAEVKRMYVRPEFRGNGLAKAILRHLETHASQEGILLLRLETGIHQVEAIALYERFGFSEIGPFGDYLPDPNSRFYAKDLGPGTR
jgi:putative acetyltransferase